jgi:hypothetical protein
VKYWEAVAKLEEWFITEAGIDVCDTGKELLQHVFETMEPEPVKSVESNDPSEFLNVQILVPTS